MIKHCNELFLKKQNLFLGVEKFKSGASVYISGTVAWSLDILVSQSATTCQIKMSSSHDTILARQNVKFMNVYFVHWNNRDSSPHDLGTNITALYNKVPIWKLSYLFTTPLNHKEIINVELWIWVNSALSIAFSSLFLKVDLFVLNLQTFIKSFNCIFLKSFLVSVSLSFLLIS